MNFENPEKKYLIDLIKAALNSQKPTPAPSGLNWEKLFLLCQHHNVEGVVCYSARKLSQKPPESVLTKLEKAYKNHVVREAVQCAEGELIASEFESKNIDYSFLKGFVIKDYYPHSLMRSMGDIDILFKDGCYEQVDDIMKKLGYEGSGLYKNVYYYEKSNGIVVEMHNSLTRDGKDYFSSPWEKLLLKESTKNRYEMTKEDFYIYMIMHSFRHFRNKGTGIRSVMDIYVFNKSFNDSLNYEFINKVFKKTGVFDFASKIKALSDFWFGSRGETEGLQDISDYILSGGTFGSFEGSFLSDLGNSTAKASKLKYLFKKAFPSCSRMCLQYPVLKKHKYLLPLIWATRGCKLLFCNYKRVFSVFGAVIKVKKSDLERIKSLHKESDNNKGDS